MHNDVLKENRRQNRRVRVAMAVKESYRDRTVLSQSSDISENGIFLASATNDLVMTREPGAKCWLEFNLPNSDVQIKARGEVIRQDQYQEYQLTAILFAALAPSHRRMIKAFVNTPQVPLPTPTFLPPPM